eukprot:scaffold1115_cov165-Amphora_coffeaeformis.AAC.3
MRQSMKWSCNKLGVVFLLVGLLAMMTIASVTTTPETFLQHDDQSPLVLACEDREGTTAPSCSFHVTEGKNTFRVCRYDGNNPATCWRVSMSVEEALPDAVNPQETMEEESAYTLKEDTVREDSSDEQSETDRSVSLGDDTSGTEIGSEAPPEEPSPEKDNPKATKPLPNDNPEQSTVTKSVPDIVQVGEYTYRPPYQEFGKEIQSLLRHPFYDNVDEEARWLHSVGIAFQHRAEEHLVMNIHASATVDDLVKRAAAAFQEALLRYKEIIASAPDGTSFVSLNGRLKRAVVYMELAQTYQLSLAYSPTIGMDYLKQAESELRSLYETTVSTKIGTAQFAVELVMAYAEVSLRLGAALLQGSDRVAGGGGLDTTIGGIAAVAEEWLLLEAGEDAETLLQNPNKIENMLKSHIPPLVAKTHQVIRYFLRSKTLWWNMLLGETNVKARLASTDAQQALLHLATSVQNLGNAWLALEQYEPAVAALEEAWRLQDETILPQMTSPSNQNERNAMLVAMGENLYSLADVYLRMGEYEKALDRYKRSMGWFRRHNVAPPQPPPPDGLANNEEQNAMILTYEQGLEEYHAMFADGVDSSDPVVSDTNGFYSGGDADYGSQTFYQRDDGYEGDLHNTLGALYLNSGDYDQAAMHLQQALRLYLKAGEAQDTTTATAHTQLALLYFQQGEYDASMEQHRLAVEIFKKIVTPGSNPLHHGGVPIVDWPNLLAEALRDLPDVHSGLPASLDIDALIEPVGETVLANMRANADGSQDAEGLNTPEQNNEDPTPPVATTVPQSGHKIHIDLDAFSEAQANETGSDEL